MKKFKVIFQVFYVIITVTLLYFSTDILLNTEQYLAKVKLSSYVKFPKYIMTVFLVVSIMMLINFIIEKWHIYQIKDGIDGLREEIIRLKAKLYDKVESDSESADDPDDD